VSRTAGTQWTDSAWPGPEQAAQFVREDLARWTPVLTIAGIKAGQAASASYTRQTKRSIAAQLDAAGR
jgi:hypothetical protein